MNLFHNDLGVPVAGSSSTLNIPIENLETLDFIVGDISKTSSPASIGTQSKRRPPFYNRNQTKCENDNHDYIRKIKCEKQEKREYKKFTTKETIIDSEMIQLHCRKKYTKEILKTEKRMSKLQKKKSKNVIKDSNIHVVNDVQETVKHKYYDFMPSQPDKSNSPSKSQTSLVGQTNSSVTETTMYSEKVKSSNKTSRQYAVTVQNMSASQLSLSEATSFMSTKSSTACQTMNDEHLCSSSIKEQLHPSSNSIHLDADSDVAVNMNPCNVYTRVGQLEKQTAVNMNPCNVYTRVGQLEKQTAVNMNPCNVYTRVGQLEKQTAFLIDQQSDLMLRDERFVQRENYKIQQIFCMRKKYEDDLRRLIGEYKQVAAGTLHVLKMTELALRNGGCVNDVLQHDVKALKNAPNRSGVFSRNACKYSFLFIHDNQSIFHLF